MRAAAWTRLLPWATPCLRRHGFYPHHHHCLQSHSPYPLPASPLSSSPFPPRLTDASKQLMTSFASDTLSRATLDTWEAWVGD